MVNTHLLTYTRTNTGVWCIQTYPSLTHQPSQTIYEFYKLTLKQNCWSQLFILEFYTLSIYNCAGFGWGSFLQKRQYETTYGLSLCWKQDLLAQCQGLFCILYHPGSRLGVHKKLRGDMAGTAGPKWQRDEPFIWHHGQDLKQGKEEEEEMFGVMAFVSPGHPYTWWSPAFLGMAAQQTGQGTWWMKSLFCSPCVCSFCFSC